MAWVKRFVVPPTDADNEQGEQHCASDFECDYCGNIDIVGFTIVEEDNNHIHVFVETGYTPKFHPLTGEKLRSCVR